MVVSVRQGTLSSNVVSVGSQIGEVLSLETPNSVSSFQLVNILYLRVS